MMEVLTLPIRKTSTCPTLPSAPLISLLSAAWMNSAWKRSGNASNQAGLYSSVVSTNPTPGAVVAGPREPCVIPSPERSRMSPSGIASRS